MHDSSSLLSENLTKYIYFSQRIWCLCGGQSLLQRFQDQELWDLFLLVLLLVASEGNIGSLLDLKLHLQARSLAALSAGV